MKRKGFAVLGMTALLLLANGCGSGAPATAEKTAPAAESAAEAADNAAQAGESRE